MPQPPSSAFDKSPATRARLLWSSSLPSMALPPTRLIRSASQRARRLSSSTGNNRFAASYTIWRGGSRSVSISARFHNTLAEIIVELARRAGQERVVLSGGCFQNKYLTERTIRRLQERGLPPLLAPARPAQRRRHRARADRSGRAVKERGKIMCLGDTG